MTGEYDPDELKQMQDLITPTSTEEAERSMPKPTKTSTLYESLVNENIHSVSADPSYYDRNGIDEIGGDNNMMASVSKEAKLSLQQSNASNQSNLKRMLQSETEDDMKNSLLEPEAKLRAKSKQDLQIEYDTKKRSYIIEESSPNTVYWELLVISCALTMAFFVPIEIAFESIDKSFDSYPFTHQLDVTMDIIFLIDIAV